ncbi:MAG: hypothetical protein ABUS49_04160, partial [Acidobacteriota bacterium]
MRLTWHIFRKDTRRCWKEIALTFALLAWLTRMDSWRSDYVPDSSEGWLNILLPLAWGYLAAVCILQDAVPGERQFWLTLPCPRRALFGAKALFLLAFIQLPYLLSNAMVLDARGFAPWLFVPRLAEQQLLVLFAVTLPAVALATLARTATQFVALAFALLGSAVVFSSVSETLGLPLVQSVPWMRIDPPRQALALSLLALSAFFVAWLQYRSRRTAVSRGVGVAGLVGACALYILLPPESSAAIEAALWPAHLQNGPVSVRLAPRERTFDSERRFQSNAVTIAIPLEVSGVPASPEVRLEQVSLEIVEPGGARYRAERFVPPPKKVSLLASMRDSGWEVLVMEPALFARLTAIPVTVRGFLTAEFHQTGAPAVLPRDARVDVPNSGKCAISGADGGLLREDGLRVTFESPRRV